MAVSVEPLLRTACSALDISEPVQDALVVLARPALASHEALRPRDFFPKYDRSNRDIQGQLILASLFLRLAQTSKVDQYQYYAQSLGIEMWQTATNEWVVMEDTSKRPGRHALMMLTVAGALLPKSYAVLPVKLLAAISACYYLHDVSASVVLGVLCAIETVDWPRQESKLLPLLLRVEMFVRQQADGHKAESLDVNGVIENLHRLLRVSTPLPTFESRVLLESPEKLIVFLWGTMRACAKRYGLHEEGASLAEMISLLQSCRTYLEWIQKRCSDMLRRESTRQSIEFPNLLIGQSQQVAVGETNRVDLARVLLDGLAIMHEYFDIRLAEMLLLKSEVEQSSHYNLMRNPDFLMSISDLNKKQTIERIAHMASSDPFSVSFFSEQQLCDPRVERMLVEETSSSRTNSWFFPSMASQISRYLCLQLDDNALDVVIAAGGENTLDVKRSRACDPSVHLVMHELFCAAKQHVQA